MGSLILFYIQTMKTTIILTFLVLFGHSTDLTDAAPANDEIAVETNGHPTPGPIQARSLDIVTSEISDRNQCQDKASGCPTWTWACTNNQWKDWMAQTYPKTCGLCPDPVQCQDSNKYGSKCPTWTWACTNNQWKDCMAQTSPKTCGVCPGNNECAKIPSWMRSDPWNRIVNGKTAPSPIPWQVHLRQGSPTAGFGYFCGGTIIDAKTILTAAHCYHGKNLNAVDYFVTAGVVHVQDGAGQSAFVEKITLHESYNPSTINNDIAILKLKTPLTFNDNVRRACLPEASFVPTGKAVASGWGLVAQFPDQSPKNLQWVTKPVVTNDKCAQQFNWSGITANMICAGDADGGESTCKGDSGGPLVVPKSSTDDTAVVIGATSFGPGDGCGKPGLPAVYAYVTRYLDWIKPKMES